MQGDMITLKMENPPDLVVFEPEVSGMCSVGGNPFWGTLTIEYQPEDLILEFVSVEEWLGHFADKPLMIEELIRFTFEEVCRVLGDIPVRVSGSFRTTVHSPAGAQYSKGGW